MRRGKLWNCHFRYLKSITPFSFTLAISAPQGLPSPSIGRPSKSRRLWVIVSWNGFDKSKAARVWIVTELVAALNETDLIFVSLSSPGANLLVFACSRQAIEREITSGGAVERAVKCEHDDLLVLP